MRKHQPQFQRWTTLRRGMVMYDVLIASVAVGIAVSIATVSIISIQRRQQASDRLQMAAFELNNQLEHAVVLPWKELTVDGLKGLTLSPEFLDSVPGTELQWHVTEATEPRAARQLVAEIRWPDSHAGVMPPLKLTAWVFAEQEQP